MSANAVSCTVRGKVSARTKRPLLRATIEALETRRLLSSGTFTIPSASNSANGNYDSTPMMVAGPDGNLWIADSADSRILRMTPGGAFTDFALDPNSAPVSIAAGPDGNLWFADAGSNQIGRITTGGKVTEFPIPTAGMQPLAIAAGSDGNLWFVEINNGSSGDVGATGDGTVSGTPVVMGLAQPAPAPLPLPISGGAGGSPGSTPGSVGGAPPASSDGPSSAIGRITPQGKIAEFPLDGVDVSWYPAIVAGPDGALWFNAEDADGNGQVGRITTAGKSSFFAISADPTDLAVGADQNLWVTTDSSQIDRITTGGSVTPFSVGTDSSETTSAIVAGADGNLWFATSGGMNDLGRISTAGNVLEFAAPGGQVAHDNGIASIAEGPDQALWMVDGSGAQVQRLDPRNALLASNRSMQVTAGSTTSATLASFMDIPGGAPAADYSASINFGDGSAPVAGQITPNSSGGFDVSVTRDWTIGQLNPTVTVHDLRDPGRTAIALPDIVASAPAPVGAAIAVNAPAGQLFSGPVAHFTNVLLNSLSSYSATIDWGDGHITAGQITARGDGVDVSGTLRYAHSGSYTITTTLTAYAFPIGIGGGGIGVVAVGTTSGGAVASGSGSATAVKTHTKPVRHHGAKTTTTGSTTSGTTSTTVAVPVNPPTEPPIPILSPPGGGSGFPGSGSASGTATVAHGVMDGTGYSLLVTHDQPFNDTVASFTLTDPKADLSHFHATIEWTDSFFLYRDYFPLPIPTQQNATITPDGQGGFTVSASETFPIGGFHHFTVTISDDRLGTGDAAIVGVAYGQLVVDGPYPLPLAGGAGSAPTGTSTQTGGGTAGSANPTLAEHVTATPVALRAKPGQTFSGDVGLLSGIVSGAPHLADLHGMIDWGDGKSATAATFTIDSAGVVHVRGKHRFARTASGTVSVALTQTLFNNGQPSALFPIHLPTLHSALQPHGTTSAGKPHAHGVTLHAKAGKPLHNARLGTITLPTSVSGTYQATIDWGDGTTSLGAVAASARGVLKVLGDHTFASAGKYTVHVSVEQLSPGQASPTVVGIFSSAASVAKAQHGPRHR